MSAAGKTQRYVGLRYFEERDAHLFYGRDEHVAELLGKLAENRFVAVLGSSGCGKSSLVRAGLLPELRSGMIPKAGFNWNVVEFRPGQAPLVELSNALKKTLGVETARESVEEGPLGIAKVVAEAKLDEQANVLVIADQFEEVFHFQREEGLLGRGPEATEQTQALARRLLDAAAQRELPIYVLLVMRSDHLGECAQFPDLPERMSESLYLVPRLRRDQLQEAIEAPVAGAIDSSVVQRLLSEVGRDPDQLPRLQHLLGRMWDRARGERLAMTHYDDAGGWEGALDQEAEEVWAGFTEEDRPGIQRMFQWITDKGAGTQPVRRPARFSHIIEATKLTPGKLREVVQVFHERGLLRASSADRSGDPVIDLTHESVARQWKRLRDAIDEEAESAARLRFIRQSVGKNPLAGLALEEALDLKNRMSEFHVWSKRYLPDAGSAEQIIDWIDDSQKKEQAARKREARDLAESAKSLEKRDPELSLILGMYSWGKGHSIVDLEQTFHDAIRRSPVRLRLPGHEDVVFAVGWSPDGSRLATASRDGTAKVWDAESAQELLTLRGHLGPLYGVAWSMDGRRLVTASHDATAKVWEAGSGWELFSLRGHHDFVRAVAWSPDGSSLATASGDGTAMLWEAESGQELLTLQGHRSPVYSVAWSPDGSRLATTGEDGTAKVWEARSGRELSTLRGHRSPVYSIAWSPDGSRLATASGDNTAKVWDSGSGRELLTLRGHQDIVWSVAWYPDGSRLATASADLTAKVWEAGEGRESQTLRSHQHAVRAIEWSPDGSRLATASADRTARVWEARRGCELLILRGHQGPLGNIAWSPEGGRLATASGDTTVKLWDAGSGREFGTLSGHQDFVLGVAWSPDGSRLATASREQTAMLWEAESGRELLTLRGHQGSVLSIAWSPDGGRVATASLDRTAKVWDTMSGRELLTLKGHRDSVGSIAWSPNGRFLATGSWDQKARVWDTRSGQKTRTLRGHLGRVHSVAWSPDGKRLATAGADRTAKVWETSSWQLLETQRDHGGPVRSIAWSPDGKRLATASEDRTVRVWEPGSERKLTLSGHRGPVRSIAWSPDGKMLASAGEDRVAQVCVIGEKELLRLVHKRITRELTQEECKLYFGAVQCPLLPQPP